MPFTDYSLTAPGDFKTHFNDLRKTHQRSEDGFYYTTGATLLLTSAVTAFNQILNLSDRNSDLTRYISYAMSLIAVGSAVTAGVCKLVVNNTSKKINAELDTGIRNGFFKSIPERPVAVMSGAYYSTAALPLLVSEKDDMQSLVEEGVRARAFKK